MGVVYSNVEAAPTRQLARVCYFVAAVSIAVLTVTTAKAQLGRLEHSRLVCTCEGSQDLTGWQ